MQRSIARVSTATIFVVLLIIALHSLYPPSDQSQPNVVRSGLPVNPVLLENQKPGTDLWKSPDVDRYTELRIEREQQLRAQHRQRQAAADLGGQPLRPAAAWTDDRVIKGYASKTSVNVGSSINFHISSDASQYTMTVYRMGWYGGNGGTQMLGPVTLTGSRRSNPTPQAGTGLIAANWPVSYTLNVPNNWTSGMYLVWLQNTGSNYVGYIPFVVRNDAQTADILYLVVTSTWQAYNNWGGKSTYEYNSDGGRAFKVSYDRPYQQDDGAGHYFNGDYHMIQWLEMMGYNATYATSEDLHSNPNLMSGRKVLVSVFHDEYYSMEMYDHLLAARDSGKDLAFFTSNNIYWQIRYENSSSGAANRVIVCYKKQGLDPYTTQDPYLYDADPEKRRRTTVLFRDPPVNRPENQVLGVMFEHLVGFGDHRPWTVKNASHWIYEGTGLTNGSTINMLVGYEWDRTYNNGVSPANMTLISETSIYTEDTYFLHQAVIWQAQSGAWVLSTSTNYWQYFLMGNWIWPIDSRVRRMTQNALNRMISDNTLPPVGATATRTPSRTATPTLTVTRSATPAASATPGTGETGTPVFYRAVNIGGAALTIDGNAWEANTGTTPNLTTTGNAMCNPYVTLNPSTDANRTTMIRCARQHWAHNIIMSSVPNDTYEVAVYVWQQWASGSPESYSLRLEGATVHANYQPGATGYWQRLGPWRVAINDGTINVGTTGDLANISGIEVYRVTAGTGATASVTPSSTPSRTPSRTPALTQTRTLTPSPSPSAAVSATPSRTPSRTPTPTPTTPAAATFDRAYNLGGPALTIGGHAWRAGTTSTSMYLSGGSTFCNQAVALAPTTTAEQAQMLRCSFRTTTTAIMTATITDVPNGLYNVYLYVWEDDVPSKYWMSIASGQASIPSIQTGSAGWWQKYGPFTVQISNGAFDVAVGGGAANISGIEFWRR